MENKAPRLITLIASLQPLQEYFNSNQGKPRFIALVSPTCLECLAGARAVQHSILQTFPDAPLSVSLVWVRMLDNDNEETAYQAAAPISDTRVLHFYDGANRAGKARAGLFGETSAWRDLPPRPQKWFHQLGNKADSWANLGQYRCGEALEEALHQTMGKQYRFKTSG